MEEQIIEKNTSKLIAFFEKSYLKGIVFFQNNYDHEKLSKSKLVLKDNLLRKLLKDVISGIKFFHENCLSFQDEICLENIFFNVKKLKRN